jgi:hypothetical protein
MPIATSSADFFRRNICRRAVDADTRARARRAWQPLIVCEQCVITGSDGGRPAVTVVG